VGIGATVIEKLVIGEGATIAAGAVVLHDVEERTLVAGIPAVAKKSLQRETAAMR
jgi:acetyltransferase-like isoleucine patch superfamily enzyme